MFSVRHSKDDIFNVSKELGAIIGKIDNIVIFEKETFATVYKEWRIVKAVKLVLADYIGEINVAASIVKVEFEGVEVLVISEMMNY